MSQLSSELLAANRAADEPLVAGLREELAGLDPSTLRADEERLATWINLYNALVVEEFRKHPRRGSLIRHSRLFNKTAYTIGGDVFTLNVIEHGLLRRNAKPAYALRRTLQPGDRRLDAAPSGLDARVHFALNCAAASCPPIHAYEADCVDDQLDLATRSYVSIETELDRERRRVKLPYLLKLYAADFGETRDDAVRFAADHLPESDGGWLRAELERGGLDLGWSKYDWTVAA